MDSRILDLKKVLFFIGVAWSTHSFSQYVSQKRPLNIQDRSPSKFISDKEYELLHNLKSPDYKIGLFENVYDNKNHTISNCEYSHVRERLLKARKQLTPKRKKSRTNLSPKKFISDQDFKADLQVLRSLDFSTVSFAHVHDRELGSIKPKDGYKAFYADTGICKIVREVTCADDFFDQNLFPTQNDAVEELTTLYRKHHENEQKIALFKRVTQFKNAIELVTQNCQTTEQKITETIKLLKKTDPSFIESNLQKITWHAPPIEPDLKPLVMNVPEFKAYAQAVFQFAPVNTVATINKFLHNFAARKNESVKIKAETEKLQSQQMDLSANYQEKLREYKILEAKYNLLHSRLQSLKEEDLYPDRPTDEALAACLDVGTIKQDLTALLLPQMSPHETRFAEKVFHKCVETTTLTVLSAIGSDKLVIQEKDPLFEIINRRINVFATLTARYKEAARRLRIHNDAFLAKLKELSNNPQFDEYWIEMFESFDGEVDPQVNNDEIIAGLPVIPPINQLKNKHVKMLSQELIREQEKVEAVYKEAHKEFAKVEIIFTLITIKYQEFFLNQNKLNKAFLLHEYAEDCRAHVREREMTEKQSEDKFVSNVLTKVLKAAQESTTPQEKAHNFIAELTAHKDNRLSRLIKLYEQYTESARLREQINALEEVIASIEKTIKGYSTASEQYKKKNMELYSTLLRYSKLPYEEFRKRITHKLEEFNSAHEGFVEKPAFTQKDPTIDCTKLAETFDRLLENKLFPPERMVSEITKLFTDIEKEKATVETLKKQVLELDKNKERLLAEFDSTFNVYCGFVASHHFLIEQKQTHETTRYNKPKPMIVTKKKVTVYSEENQKKVTIPVISTREIRANLSKLSLAELD